MPLTVLTAESMTVTTAVNALAVIYTAASGPASVVRIRRVEISESTQATGALVRGAFSTQTGVTMTGTATTPVPVIVGGTASGLTGSTSPGGAAGRTSTNLSVNTTPNYTDRHTFAFLNTSGYKWEPRSPEEFITVPASTIFVVRFLADPGTLTGWAVSVWMDES